MYKTSIIASKNGMTCAPVFFSIQSDMLDYIKMLEHDGYEWTYKTHLTVWEEVEHNG